MTWKRKEEEPDPDLREPRRLKSGKWIGCRHYVPGGKPFLVGFDLRTNKFVAHEHDYEEGEI